MPKYERWSTISKRIAVIGSSGFVGSAVVEAALRQGHIVDHVRLRIDPRPGTTSHPSEWRKRFFRAYEDLSVPFSKADVVVNAAGIAAPQATSSVHLWLANVVLPVLATQVASDQAVPRLVHVSSAAVQGRQNPLNEEPSWQPFSPYSRSKAEAERLLLAESVEQSIAVVVYRATSVHGPGRPLTTRLARTAHQCAVPVCRRGAVPLPVALWCNVGAGIIHAATTESVGGIVLQPDEGMMAADLWKSFNPEVRMLNLPVITVRTGLAVLRAAGKLNRSAEAMGRRLELMLLGQHIRAAKLTESGFRLPAGIATWHDLGRMMWSSFGGTQ